MQHFTIGHDLQVRYALQGFTPEPEEVWHIYDRHCVDAVSLHVSDRTLNIMFPRPSILVRCIELSRIDTEVGVCVSIGQGMATIESFSNSPQPWSYPRHRLTPIL